MNKVNLSTMKEKNRKIVLSTIYDKQCSRVEVSRLTGLTKAAVSFIVEDLINEGMVYESESDYVGVGRKPITLKVFGGKFYSCGINITRKICEVGFIDLFGNKVCGEVFPCEGGEPNEVVQQIIDIINRQIDDNQIKIENIIGIGIAVPGPVDYINKKILNPPNFEKWHNFELGIFEKKFNKPVFVENIANAYSIYEKCFGDCTEVDNFITILVNEGIGSGILLNGRIHRGCHGLGNEIGHITIDFNGKKCSCGNIGCLEKYASIPEILLNTRYSSWKEVVDAGDDEILEKEAMYLSSAIASVINLFDLRVLVFAGDIAYCSDKVFSKILKHLENKVVTNSKIEIKASKINNGIIMAGAMVVYDFFHNDN